MRKKLLNKRILIVTILAIAVVFAVPNVSQAVDIMQKQLALFQEVYELATTYHINEVDQDKLTKGAIDGMLNALDDPYTTYFTEEEYQAFLQSVDNKFVGIGIYIDDSSDYIKVQSVIPQSPAEVAELKAGDQIIEVDGTDIKNKRTVEVAGLIRGPQETYVKLKIKRADQLLTKEIQRKEIQLPETDASVIADKVGYIRLYSFGSMSSLEFNKRLEELEANNIDGLILDLRGNPGGYLGAAVDIAENFIKDAPIAYLVDKNEDYQEISVEGGTLYDKPLIVLIDHGSASASEILAGALKDYNIAKVIGHNSFGKGTVQHLLSLENGGYLKLTLSEYYTALGHKVNGIGIQPDIAIENPAEQLIQAVEEITRKAVYSPAKGVEWRTVEQQELIALRPFVKYYNGEIRWNGELKAIEMGIKGDKYTINLDSNGVKLIDGTTYITLEQLAKDINRVIYAKKEENLKLLYK